MKLVARLLAAAAAISMTAFGAAAQTYPDRTITIVVPFAAGGPTDTVARLVAEAMSKDLGQQVIVENVGGAGGTLGAAASPRPSPTATRCSSHHIGMATSATLYRKLPYDTLNAFDYVGLVTDVPMTIVAKQDFAADRPQGAGRLREGQQGQGHLRQCRHRRGLASLRHAVHERHRDAADDRPL